MKLETGFREGYRAVSLYPTAEDFEQTNFDSLSRNIIEGSYRDVEHYLNVQFHLLREDFICPLREGINRYKRLVSHPSQEEPKEQESGVHIYKGVKVISAVCGREQTDDISYRVQLDKKYCGTIKWDDTKRLMFGSLVMFSNDDFKSFQLAVVTERDVNSLRKGFLSVKFVGRDVYGSKIHRDQYVMAESDAFFEPVYQTLKNLQFIKCLPMEKYFLVHDVSPRRPSYMSLGSVIGLGNHVVALNYDSAWPDHRSINMNESQYAALKASLRQEFTVIQGPPGTGKTFLALNIIKILLNNFQSVRPILLLSYTNHALDQFLEGTLKFTKRVVRIGGQSQNKILNQYNFQKIKEQLLNNNRSRGKKLNWYTRTGDSGEEERVYVDWPKMFDRSFSVFKRELKQSYIEILVDTEVVRTIEDQLGLVNIFHFNNTMGLYDSTDFRNNDDFLAWLLGNSYVTIKSLMKSLDDREKSDQDDHSSTHMRSGNLPGHSEKDLKSHISLTFETLEGVRRMLQNQQYRNAELIRILRSVVLNIRNGLNSNVLSKPYEDSSYRGDLWSLSTQARWDLYNIWVKRIRMEIVRKLEAKKTEHAQKSSQLKDRRTQEDLELLVELKPAIIGITSTGAARLHQLLSSLAPRIVIVEEAAQVLEAHIVASLSTSCQHLMLIGDHKQLRPSSTTYELAKRFDMDISLFERMVKNGVCCKTLNVQHRMKPNIAALIAPSIYPDLTNHPSVSTYPPILGVSKNLFFIDHTAWEKKDLVSESRSNQHEAEFMIALCRYLILQGYQASDIVILTTYSSQKSCLKNLQKKEELLEDVRITVVDNYQEEECKIVLLSLVRSNREGNIGFLGAENRICVALSRAKHGLYIIGNMQLLKAKSTLWKQINATLQSQDAIGEELTLLCKDHHVETRVKTGSDFQRMEHPECCRTRGILSVRLLCGHHNSLGNEIFIGDDVGFKCLQLCKRKICNDDHPCPLPCYAPCTGCQVQVNRVLPQCGHIAAMPCMENPNKFICTRKINGGVCGDKDKLKENRLNSPDHVPRKSLEEQFAVARTRQEDQLAARKRQEDLLAARKRQEDQLAARKRQEDQLAARKRQEDQLAARKRQEDLLAARKRQEDLLAARKRQEDQLAARKRQEDQLAARKRQEDQLAARKRQEDLLAARKRQEDLLAARKRQEDQLAARKRQEDQLAARKRQEDQLAARKRQEDQLAARKRQEDQLAARKRQEDLLAARKRQEDQLAARKRQEDQLAARKRQEDQLAARKRQEDLLAARKRQEDLLAARKRQEDLLAARKRQEDQLAARKRQEDQLAARKRQEDLLAARKRQEDLLAARKRRGVRVAIWINQEDLNAARNREEDLHDTVRIRTVLDDAVRIRQINENQEHQRKRPAWKKLLYCIMCPCKN